MLELLAIKKNINCKSQNNVYIKIKQHEFISISPGSIADKSCDEIRLMFMINIKLFVVKFRGSWKLSMAYPNNLAQLSSHLKANRKKLKNFISRNLMKGLYMIWA